MSLPRFRLVQGKALGERSTPPAGVNMTPEPPQPQIKQEIEYADTPEQSIQGIKTESPVSPPQQVIGGTPQSQPMMNQRPMQQIHYQPQPQLQPQHQPQHQPQLQPQPQPHPPQQFPQMIPPNQNQAAQNISAEERNVQKCVRFLKTLISLSNNKDAEMPDKAARVKNLIQGVIYMETTAEEFTQDLQQVLKSQAQPHLLPFLQNTLPALRNAVRNGSASVEDVHPPPGYVFNNGRAPPPQLPPHPQLSQQSHTPMTLQQPIGSQQIINRLNGPVIQQRPPLNNGPPLQSTPQIPVVRTMSGQAGPMTLGPIPSGPQQMTPIPQQTAPQTPQNLQNSMAPPGPVPMEVDPEPARTRQYPEGSLKSSILKPDEVLNRITKRMMASCSVEEEALIAISDAVESHLREMITMMAGVAEHRVESMRIPDNYMAIDDVKRQLRFLEDLDRQEEEMRESREKESLIRMSKNKNSGKETIEKAKEMQRQDAEAKRNRDANAAAIAALSTNRTVKNKWEGASSASTAPRPRTVRVTTRDLHLLVNQDNRFNGTFIREKLSYGGPAIDATI